MAIHAWELAHLEVFFLSGGLGLWGPYDTFVFEGLAPLEVLETSLAGAQESALSDALEFAASDALEMPLLVALFF